MLNQRNNVAHEVGSSSVLLCGFVVEVTEEIIADKFSVFWLGVNSISTTFDVHKITIYNILMEQQRVAEEIQILTEESIRFLRSCICKIQKLKSHGLGTETNQSYVIGLQERICFYETLKEEFTILLASVPNTTWTTIKIDTMFATNDH